MLGPVGGRLALVLAEPFGEEHLVTLVVFPLRHYILLHLLPREQRHILAVKAVWWQDESLAVLLNTAHILHKSTVALLPFLRVAAHAPQVVQDVVGTHLVEHLAPQPFDKAVAEEDLPLLHSVLLEDVVEWQHEFSLVLGQLAQVLVTGQVPLVVNSRKEEEHHSVEALLVHELLGHLEVVHEEPDVIFHLREVPELLAGIDNQLFE